MGSADQCYLAAPLSRRQLREIAAKVRKFAEISGPYVDIVSLLELWLPKVAPNFELVIQPASVLGNDHGRTYPSQGRIEIREDVYIRANQGNGRDRMTLAHELGHLLLHDDVAHARSFQSHPPPAYRDPEWQAKCFAAELLIPLNHIGGCAGPADIAKRFGVSMEAATYQWRVYQKEGPIRRAPQKIGPQRGRNSGFGKR